MGMKVLLVAAGIVVFMIGAAVASAGPDGLGYTLGGLGIVSVAAGLLFPRDMFRKKS